MKTFSIIAAKDKINELQTEVIIAKKEDEGYGRLDKENAQNLQNILFN